MGWIGWTLLILVALLLTGFGLWRWAVNAQSVATLDRADAFFTGSAADVSEPIPFGDTREQVLVVAKPKAQSDPAPVVIFIHGGSWANGYAPDYAFVARNLAAEGYIGVSAGYRLVPGGEFPAMLEDGAKAVRWVIDNIARHGGDPTRIYLKGHSAGAYNAVMLALDAQWLEGEGVPRTAIKGVIGLAGPYDFLPLDSDSTRAAFGGAAQLEKTQPVQFANQAAPPMLLITGDADTTVRPRNSHALARALTGAGQPTEPLVIPDIGHIPIVMALSRPFEGDGMVKRAVFDFLARQEQAASADIQASRR